MPGEIAAFPLPSSVCDDKTKETDCNVRDWLRYGAEKEDAEAFFPLLDQSHRPLNHFHEPISNQGLNDVFSGLSALIWAQNSAAQSQEVEGDQSWLTLRSLYLMALTECDTEVRRQNFIALFKGLGHQMHLVQDMAVPYHVRNDAHVEDAIQGTWASFLVGNQPLYFENWAITNDSKINGPIYNFM